VVKAISNSNASGQEIPHCFFFDFFHDPIFPLLYFFFAARADLNYRRAMLMPIFFVFSRFHEPG
jgi:hypothetical protein